MTVAWFIYTVAVATSVSLAFNIDVKNTRIFTAKQKDFFQNKALRFLSDQNKGTLITAPEQRKGPEETCASDLNPTHHCLIVPEISPTDTPIPIRRLELSIAEDSTHFQITVCSPSAVHPCYEDSSLNKACYKTADHRRQIITVPPDSQESTRKTVDLVFLFDGSTSMTQSEFEKNKVFIEGIMNSMKNTSVKFAAVQFASDYRKVFDFNDYEAGRALVKLVNEKHLKGLTNTYTALTFVLHEILENPAAGASPDATKVLLLITDGDPSQLDRRNIVKQYDDKNIIRIVIGLKEANLEKFRTIASEPKDKNAFKIESYDGLTQLLENVVSKMHKMEECNVTGNITDEMSQRGFSAVFHKVCSPRVVSECSDNSYLNTECHKVKRSLTTMFKESTRKTADLVFLFDGSTSLTQSEFEKTKVFIEGIMNSLKNTSVKFAAVQFASDYRKVFDFNDYEAGRALVKLMNERHLKGLTGTYTALTFVLHEILENPAAGASPDATKVLLLITDGDPSQLDRRNIVKQYDDKNIIRIVIGLKEANLEKFRTIASEPKDKNAFKIESYDGLTQLLENVVSKMHKMEECNVTGNITDEMSQREFSAVFHKDTLILGSEGSNSWRSSLREHQEQTGDTDIQEDSYLGNSVSFGEKNGFRLYFVGSPRFERTGQVVLFRHHCKNWTANQRLRGNQIGSHFGAELCSLDVDSNSNTDFLLVGAPMFNLPQEKKEGQIYIYRLTDKMLLEDVHIVEAPSMGRFGTTISSLADLNGDGLRDIAVGAPLENDNSGAVYIYLGDRQRGIRHTFSQRIMGKNIKCGMSFFGQAIIGELGEDGLPGIVVGSQGAAVVLRSKPVFNVMAHLLIQPEEISTEELNCPGADENLPLTVKACFIKVEATKSKAGAMNSGLKITYTLTVDPIRQTNRGFFSPADKTARNIMDTVELRNETSCFSHSIYISKSMEDTLSPVDIRINFFQADSESASAILNLDTEREVVAKIPFKN